MVWSLIYSPVSRRSHFSKSDLDEQPELLKNGSDDSCDGPVGLTFGASGISAPKINSTRKVGVV